MLGSNGELSRAGVESLEENRKGSGLSAVKISIKMGPAKGLHCITYEECSAEEEQRGPRLPNC